MKRDDPEYKALCSQALKGFFGNAHVHINLPEGITREVMLEDLVALQEVAVANGFTESILTIK